MKEVIISLLAIFLLASCGKADDYYSYLSQPGVEAEEVSMKYVASSAQSPFNYTLQAQEMVVNWGDGSSLSEYVFFDDVTNTDSIKALSYNYNNQGTYDIKVKALQLRSLLLQRSENNYLTELVLTDCIRLRKLYCDNQPLSVLDIKDCPELRVLSCGSTQQELTLNNISVASKLGELSINGHLVSVDIDLLENDSLRIIHLKHANLSAIQLNGLPELRILNFDSCPDLQNIYIGSNTYLSEIVLTNNISLDAGALNDLFEALPSTDDDRRYITLSGNKGDDRCNKNIALNKGWSFR